MKINLAKLDRRVIYFLVFVALSIPLLTNYTIPPARMKSADKLYEVISKLEVGPADIAMVVLDFGPNTRAENEAQAEVVIEHLMRRRIRIMLFSQLAIAEPFLVGMPERIAARLSREIPGQTWQYGRDWVNLGYRPGSTLFVRAIPQSTNLLEFLNTDARGNAIKDLEGFKNLVNFQNIKLLAEFTGTVGALDPFIGFFQTKEYRPQFVHGCTSITIPEAFSYLDSGQLSGLLEGIAGAAWYSQRLSKEFPARGVDNALKINTGLGVAHLVIILLVLVGNIVAFFSRGES